MCWFINCSFLKFKTWCFLLPQFDGIIDYVVSTFLIIFKLKMKKAISDLKKTGKINIWQVILTLSIIVIISGTCVELDNFEVRHIQLNSVTNTKTTILRDPPQILSQIRINDWFVRTPAKHVPYHCSNGNVSSKLFSSKCLKCGYQDGSILEYSNGISQFGNGQTHL